MGEAFAYARARNLVPSPGDGKMRGPGNEVGEHA